MDMNIQQKCDLFINSFWTLKNNFNKASKDMLLLSAVIFTGYDKEVDLLDMKRCEGIIRNNENQFSEFRGPFHMSLITKMCLKSEPEKYYLRVKMTYDMLNQSEWIGSDYKLLAAMSICDNTQSYNVVKVVEKALEIYKIMKECHPYITSDEDIAFASLLAMNELEIEDVIKETEINYNYLKSRFKHKNAIQSLSHVLSLSGNDSTEKCSKVMNIFNDLKSEGKEYGTYFELSALGMFTLVNVKEKDIVKDIIEVDNYLKDSKVFNQSSVGNTRRLMYAALLVSDFYIPKQFDNQQVAMSSSIATLLAEEITLTAAIANMTKIMN